jgi:methyltransferase (TIGR00027 family)
MNAGELHRLARRLMEIARAATADHGDPPMSPGELTVFADVMAHPDSSVRDITARTGFTQSHVSASIARLRAAGQAETVTDPADGRRTLVRVTERATTAIVRRATRPVDDTLAGALYAGDPATVEHVRNLLADLAGLLLPPTRGGEVAPRGTVADRPAATPAADSTTAPDTGGDKDSGSAATGPATGPEARATEDSADPAGDGAAAVARTGSGDDGPPPAGPVPAGVGRPALGMAHIRAEESDRPDRLFDDPFAGELVVAAPDALPGEASGTPAEAASAPAPSRATWAMLVAQGAIRTRFYDDYLLDACAAGCRQVVLLGAGLDTRAYRLEWPPGVRLFELDRPDVMAFKERVLARHGATPRCGRRGVPVDLRAPWSSELTRAGFAAGRDTVWLAEGLLAYLTEQEAARLLTVVSRLSVPGSRLALEYGEAGFSWPAGDLDVADRGMGEDTAMWRSGLGSEAPVWLSRHGWRTRVHEVAAVARGYGRPPPASERSGPDTFTRDGTEETPVVGYLTAVLDPGAAQDEAAIIDQVL